jgi:hypothetical protein
MTKLPDPNSVGDDTLLRLEVAAMADRSRLSFGGLGPVRGQWPASVLM